MAREVKIAQTGDLAPGQGRCYDVEGQAIALFNVDGEFYAIQDACSHLGASLAEGDLSGNVVTCPWHSAEFNVKTGEALCPPADAGVQRFPVKVEGADVLVELD